jgi:hypothetical protein
MVRFQPWAMSVQTRFRWRHKETDRWRRLMDATCFQIDWMSQTLGPTFAQSSGHWTHIVTCAHVICPWDYPNYYPPSGPTKFVSRVTLNDTMTQVRLNSLQGHVMVRHFTSNQHVYVHKNPRLDLCVIHPEQNLKRMGEMKMLSMQNEGHIIRPRLELLEELEVGDHVWVYGLQAHESLFDEEKYAEPLMIPRGVRAVVAAKTREHFFIDTKSIEGSEKGEIGMGMCGSVVMRKGKCVGMLTAKVHDDSPTVELAGLSMCTYTKDIFEFCLEVERQIKNPSPVMHPMPTRFEERREAEGRPPKEHVDYELHDTRLARHVKSSSSLHHMEETYMTEEDHVTSSAFGRSGIFNQETQENMLGCDMNTSKVGEKPAGFDVFGQGPNGKPVVQTYRPDNGPTGIYLDKDSVPKDTMWDSTTQKEMKNLFEGNILEKDMLQLQLMRQQLEAQRVQQEQERMAETAVKHGSRAASGKGADSDPWNIKNTAKRGERSDGPMSLRDMHDMLKPDPEDPPTEGQYARTADTINLEKEAAYNAELRQRHKQRPRPFGDDDLGGVWGDH